VIGVIFANAVMIIVVVGLSFESGKWVNMIASMLIASLLINMLYNIQITIFWGAGFFLGVFVVWNSVIVTYSVMTGDDYLVMVMFCVTCLAFRYWVGSRF